MGRIELRQSSCFAVFRAMYSTCLFCNSSLGNNDQIAAFPVGHRLAFDPARGRLWVICTRCGRWNLSPLEERWEAIDECERLFRGTRLRYSTDNIGLARVGEHLELVRIGPALLPEIASWRYGARIERYAAKRMANSRTRRSFDVAQACRVWIARRAAAALAGYATTVGLSDEAMLKLRTFRRGDAVLARTVDDTGSAHRHSLCAPRRRRADSSRPRRAVAARRASRRRHRPPRRGRRSSHRREDARVAQFWRRQQRRSAARDREARRGR